MTKLTCAGPVVGAALLAAAPVLNHDPASGRVETWNPLFASMAQDLGR